MFKALGLGARIERWAKRLALPRPTGHVAQVDGQLRITLTNVPAGAEDIVNYGRLIITRTRRIIRLDVSESRRLTVWY